MIVVSTLTTLSNLDLVSGGTGHGIQHEATAPHVLTLKGMTFAGYASADGSTGNEAINVLRTTGSVTIFYEGVAPSVQTAGATIVKVNDVSGAQGGGASASRSMANKPLHGQPVVDSSGAFTGPAQAFIDDIALAVSSAG